MPTIAWVAHNNTNAMARLIVEGLRELGRDDFEHISTREDLMGLREPDLSVWSDPSVIGEYPDHAGFAPELATPGFWERLPDADYIGFIVDAGVNHNALRAAEAVRRHDLYHRLIFVEEDERGLLHPDYADIFLKARLAVVSHRPRLYLNFRPHPHVVNFGFNGLENRYRQYEPAEFSGKRYSVFYRGRASRARFPHRLPFIEALGARRYPDPCIMPVLPENTEHHDFVWQHVSGNRHNVRYYELLAESKVSIYLNGGNPSGFQFWENAAMKAAQVIQSPKPGPWYDGGAYATDVPDPALYDPPFLDGVHYLVFESPDEMIEKIDYLLAHDSERERMASACYELAVRHYTSRARAERFLAHLERRP